MKSQPRESSTLADRAELFRQKGTTLKLYGFAALAICVAAYSLAFSSFPFGGTSAWGGFGDFLGGVAGTAVAVLTLSAVADTLALQADELAATRSILNAQRDLAERQAFDSTFFKLLEHFRGVATKDGTKHAADRLNSAYIDASGIHGNFGELETLYEQVYRKWEGQLGPYFRGLFHLLKFIDESPLAPERKHSYASLVRAGLTPDELLLLYVNVIAYEEGRTGLKPYVERFGLLKHARTLDSLVLQHFRAIDSLAESSFQAKSSAVE